MSEATANMIAEIEADKILLASYELALWGLREKLNRLAEEKEAIVKRLALAEKITEPILS